MPLIGSIRVPSDKSISHRAVLFSALARGTSHLRDLLVSDDVLSSLAAVEKLGAQVERREGAHGIDADITGFAGKPACAGELDIDCGNSGTTTRLLMGLVCGLGVDAVLHGDDSLSARPMQRVIEPLSQMGACIESESGTLPAHVRPVQGGLRAIDYTSPKASAQVKSAVLLAGLQAQGRTSVTEPAKSRDHTELLLPAFGVPVAVDGLTVSVDGPAQLSAHDMSAPGGYENTRLEGAEPVGDVVVSYGPQLSACTVSSEEIPTLIDEIPVLALAAAAAEGETVFESAGELRVKESDRFAAIVDGLAAFGVRAWAEGDDLHIQGTGEPLYYLSDAMEDDGVVELPTYHDHRLAMTWYLMGLASEAPVTLDDAACVSVSWPGFYADIEALLQ